MQLAKQASALEMHLYDEAMNAAIAGDRTRSDRLQRIAERALRRYERRYQALRGKQSKRP